MLRLAAPVVAVLLVLTTSAACASGGGGSSSDAGAPADGSVMSARLGAAFVGRYELRDLGPVPLGALRGPWPGDVAVPPDDPSRLLIANYVPVEEGGGLYSVGLARDADRHVVGFEGQATLVVSAGYPFALEHGPGGVLFVGYNEPTEGGSQDAIGQVRPGSSAIDARTVVGSFAPLEGVADGEVRGVAVSPDGGQLKVALSFERGGQDAVDWYSLDLVADGSGTFETTAAAYVRAMPNVAAGLAYVPGASPGFGPREILVPEYLNFTVATFVTDEAGDPTVSTRREFITGLNMPAGAAIDAASGDFLFSVLDGSADGTDEVHLWAVRGFVFE